MDLDEIKQMEKNHAVYVGTPWAQKLQSRKSRKIIVTFYLVMTIALAAITASFVWFTFSQQELSLTYPSIVLAVIVFLQQPSIFALLACLGGAVPMPGRPFDERQQQNYLESYFLARPWISFTATTSLMFGLVGYFTSIFFLSYEFAPALITISVFVVVAALSPIASIHYLILAWNSEDEEEEFS